MLKRDVFFHYVYLFAVGLCIAWLAGIFGWTLYENFLFTDSYDFLNVYNTDEMLFHDTVHTQRSRLTMGDWAAFFSETNAGYGNIYWAFLGLTTWPLYELGWHTMVMSWPRQVSLLSYAICFVFFYRLCRKQNKPVLPTLLAMVLIASSSSALWAAVLLWTNHPVSVLVIGAFYLLFLRKEGDPIWPGAAVYGAALGLKLTAVFFLPIFFLLVNKDGFGHSLSFLKRNFASIMTAGITGVLAYSPALLFYPFGYDEVKDSYAALAETLATNMLNRPEAPTWWANMREGYFASDLNLFLVGAAVLIAVTLLIRRRKFTDVTVALASLVAVVAVMAVAKSVKNYHYFVGLYSLPSLFILPLVFLEPRISRRWLTAMLAIFVTANYWTNWSSFRFQVSDVHNQYYGEEARTARTKYQILLKTLSLRKDDRIYLNCRMAFPLGKMATPFLVSHYYQLREIPLDFNTYSVFAFDKYSEGWSAACEDIEDREKSKKCIFVELILKDFSSYKVLYADKDLFVVRTN